MFQILPRIKRKVNHLTIYYLDRLWPKDSTLVLFGQKRGGYADNSRALFTYMREHSHLRSVWLTNDKSRVDNEHFYLANSWRGFLLALRAGSFIVSHGAGDISYSGSFSERKTYFVVWHGIPLKRIALLDAKIEGTPREKLVAKEIAKYDYYFAASVAEAETLKRCRKLPSKKNILITGLPRNDALFSKTNAREVTPDRSLIEKLRDRVVLYAPTFRDIGETRFFPFDEVSFDILNALLERLNAYLLFRPHPNDVANIGRLQKLCNESHGRMIMADSKVVPDVADLLPYVDTLITDYSSMYIDLLLLDCPSVFVPYDLEDYKRERGFLYDYNEVTPGPKVSSFESFLEALERSLCDDSYFRDERKGAKALFHHYQDSHSSKRVCELIEQVVNRQKSQ